MGGGAGIKAGKVISLGQRKCLVDLSSSIIRKMERLLYFAPPPILIVLSSLAQIPPSYFSKKGNIFNVYFVKVLWLWFTPAFLLLRPTLPSALRYVALTLTWTFVTQWFFGPAIIDRNFMFTGGECSGADVYTSSECRAVGGLWKGGHDLSGHVFLLTLTSVSLWFEMSKIQARTGTRGSPVIIRFALGVSLASMWMLMMTAAYFHTWFEKLTGLLAAYFGLFLVYWLPDYVPQLKPYLGMDKGDTGSVEKT